MIGIDLPRVVHAPSRHAYVDNIQPLNQVGEGRALRSSEIVDSRWIVAHAHEFDVLHVHFQLREIPRPALERAIDQLRKSRKGLVFTVHDLSDPQSEHQSEHLPQLELLVSRTEALFTLTGGAADEIRSTYDRAASVVPHPHVLPFELIGRRAPSRGELPIVGLHLKSGRPGLAAVHAIGTLLALHDPSKWCLQIDVNFAGLPQLERREPGALALLEVAERIRGVEVRRHERFTNDEFFEYLSSISLAVLPYRLGTHSGWAEACLDAGVVVLAPWTTHIPDQHPSIVGFDVDSERSLQDALDKGLSIVGGEFWSAEARRGQRYSITSRLHGAYLDVMSTK